MLWGLIGQGFICEVCNFVVHDRCMKVVVSPCSTVASNVIKNPVPHCWTETMHLKRKFCSVCRRKIDVDTNAVRCEVCEYCVHLECQDFSVANCKECATWVPGQDDSSVVVQHHHWREGNLPTNSKCHACKKTCWSAECLSGMRCEWCGWTAHPGCYKNLPIECNFGFLQSIMLPPYCVSIPRTDVPLETILGFQLKRGKLPDASAPRKSSLPFSRFTFFTFFTFFTLFSLTFHSPHFSFSNLSPLVDHYIFHNTCQNIDFILFFHSSSILSTARTASEDVAGGSDLKKSEVDEYPSPKDKDKDEGE